jgi:hypothetical protein
VGAQQTTRRLSTGDAAPPRPPADAPSLAVDEGPLRSELLRQIAHLEGELATLVSNACPWDPPQASPERGPGLQPTPTLERIRDELLDALDAVRNR